MYRVRSFFWSFFRNVIGYSGSRGYQQGTLAMGWGSGAFSPSLIFLRLTNCSPGTASFPYLVDPLQAIMNPTQSIDPTVELMLFLTTSTSRIVHIRQTPRRVRRLRAIREQHFHNRIPGLLPWDTSMKHRRNIRIIDPILHRHRADSVRYDNCVGACSGGGSDERLPTVQESDIVAVAPRPSMR
jgi:hypothetical protein